MSFLDRVEARVEAIVEGFFRRTSSGVLQPVEIGRKLIKSMENNKQVSIARTYVPNKYDIYLHPQQAAAMTSLRNTLIEELKGVLHEKAEKEQLSFIGDLQIEFLEDPQISAGAITVTPGFLAVSEQPTHEFSAPNETLVFSRSVEDNPEYIVVLQPDGEQMVSLNKPRLSFGRSLTSDVVLDDHNASRNHAELLQVDGSWKLMDNDSMNGTYVNEKRIKEQVLKHNDLILIGSTSLVFKEVGK